VTDPVITLNGIPEKTTVTKTVIIMTVGNRTMKYNVIFEVSSVVGNPDLASLWGYIVAKKNIMNPINANKI
jgi:hypothetical protein